MGIVSGATVGLVAALTMSQLGRPFRQLSLGGLFSAFLADWSCTGTQGADSLSSFIIVNGCIALDGVSEQSILRQGMPMLPREKPEHKFVRDELNTTAYVRARITMC